MEWKPRTFLALLVAGMACWLEWRAAVQIEYLKLENRLLRARLGRRRCLFTDPELRTLAVLAKEVGSTKLRDLDSLVSSGTLLRWHRELVAQKWTFLERRRPGRPRTNIDIELLIVRMADENPSWGYTRIRGALLTLDIKMGRGTIRRILKDHLIEPAPALGRHIPWSVFLKARWKALAAGDFFTLEVWGWRGLVAHYILFVVDLATRRVAMAGISKNPNEAWRLHSCALRPRVFAKEPKVWRSASVTTIRRPPRRLRKARFSAFRYSIRAAAGRSDQVATLRDSSATKFSIRSDITLCYRRVSEMAI